MNQSHIDGSLIVNYGPSIFEALARALVSMNEVDFGIKI